MEFCDVTDFSVPVFQELGKCPNCSSALHIGNRLCLKCLLNGALDNDDEVVGSETATLNETLAKIGACSATWRVGNHEILDEIGRGGMGVIYRAREPHSRRIVALKRALVDHADSDQILARFRREAETAARLDHPHIVPIYHVGESEDGLPFFTMKFASGRSLLEARETLRRTPRESVSLMAKVAVALQHAHNQGVLHRDLKPSNILLDDEREPLVSDFGLAKWIKTSRDLTRSLTILGTPGYIAPEQAAGPSARLTVAADVYSLGAILFELLTGRAPFLGEHALAVLRQAAERPAPKLRSLASHLDRDLETICARCLEHEPSARYHSAESLARDLESWLSGHPIVARPVSIPARLWRWSRGNRMFAATLGSSLLLAIASVPWQIHSWKLQSAAHENTLAARSVAVLPFFNLDNVAADAVFAESVASSLQHELDLVGPTRVRTTPLPPSIGWLTAEQIRRVGEITKTRTVLTGTERTIQGRKRISLRLLDGATGNPLLERILEGNAQEDLARVVGEKIGGAVHDILSTKDWSGMTRSKIDPAMRNEAAREALLAGRELMFRYTVSDFDQATALFEKTLRLAPDSSLAHAYLAIVATGRTHYLSNNSFLALGEAEAYEALRLSPDSSDAHRALAGVFYQQGKFIEALEEELRTIESAGPEEKVGRFIGMTLDILGHPDCALNWYGLARSAGGPPGDMDGHIGDCWVQLCDSERALKAYSRAKELQAGRSQGDVGICHMRLLEGDFEGARGLCRSGRRNYPDLGETEQIAAQVEFFARKFDAAESRYRNLSKTDLNGGGAFYGAITYQSALGRIRQAMGDRRGGKALLERCLISETAAVEGEPANPEALYRLAAVESSLGMLEASISHLRRAVSSGWIDYRSLAMDPRFDSLHGSRDLEAIIRDLKINVAAMRLKSSTVIKIAQP